jgi:hypothetical protein
MVYAIFLAALLLFPASSLAHCDGLDGPVVRAAQKALESGDVVHVLVWVREQDEAEIKAAFEKTAAVRRLGAEARGLADSYFYETVVRVHRAGEGEPYTGLQPAGRDLGPAIPAADNAIETGSPDALLELVTSLATHGIHERFEHVLHAKAAQSRDVKSGRAFVAAYVAFIHYVERLAEAAAATAHGH